MANQKAALLLFGSRVSLRIRILEVDRKLFINELGLLNIITFLDYFIQYGKISQKSSQIPFQKLNGLESEFKEFLGYLHIEPRSKLYSLSY